MARDETLVLDYEFKDGIARYLATRGPAYPMKSLADLIAFDRAHAGTEMPWFDQDIFERAQARGPITDARYLQARARNRRRAGRDGIDALMARYRLDAIVGPTVGPAWTSDLVNGDHVVGGDSSTLPAVAGYPHVTVPAGFVHGLPVGLSIFGRAFSEPRLIGYAYAFEQATQARRPPGFKPVT